MRQEQSYYIGLGTGDQARALSGSQFRKHVSTSSSYAGDLKPPWGSR